MIRPQDVEGVIDDLRNGDVVDLRLDLYYVDAVRDRRLAIKSTNHHADDGSVRDSRLIYLKVDPTLAYEIANPGDGDFINVRQMPLESASVGQIAVAEELEKVLERLRVNAAPWNVAPIYKLGELSVEPGITDLELLDNGDLLGAGS